MAIDGMPIVQYIFKNVLPVAQLDVAPFPKINININ
jgi:hypothetical protein